MIKILKYGEVPNSEIFARGTAAADVSAVVSDIIGDVRSRGDEALFEYCKKFDKAELSSFGDSLVDAYPAPGERVEDIFLRSRHEPLRIGVFDAEDEVSAVLTGEQVVVQRRTDAAHVQRARRTGRESYSDFSFHVSSFPFIS